MPVTLRDGSEVEDVRLDRLVHFDERSKAYPITAALPERPQLRTRTHRSTVWLDQGQEGACVSFSFHQEAGSEPVAVHGLTNRVARERYFEMQKVDPWDGGAYPGANPFYEGTSVLAGAQVMQAAGFFREYRWIGVDPATAAIDDLLLTLAHKGPVVLGIPWYSSMFSPDDQGLLRVEAGGGGGHAIMARGVSVPKNGRVTAMFPLSKRRVTIASPEPLVRLRNTWSTDWGIDGECLIRASDLERLLHDGGEGCVPLGRRRPA